MRLEIPHTRYTLANGLTLLVHEDRRTPIVSVNLWYFVGSKNERPGRTGLAHLFEHLMFEGSKNVPKGWFDQLLEDAGATNNGSTSTDRTNYWETLPSNALELALHLESDRMGWFLETMTEDKLNGQREVVKNERRQSYENRPYGLAYETLMKLLYSQSHPYHWPVIGWMEDLDSASLDDVRDFFERFYAPDNASIAIAGDVRTGDVIGLVEKYFGSIPPAASKSLLSASKAALQGESRETIEDDVHLDRLYMAWHTPELFAPGDAEMDIVADVLGAGKASRLYRRLVHDLEIAQDVEAYQNSGQIGSSLMVSVTAREGVSLDALESETRAIVSALANDLSQRELERARNHIETATIDSLQSVGGFGGKADRLNHYYFYTRDAGFFATDMARYQAVTVESARAELGRTLDTPAAILHVVRRAGA